LYLAKWFPVGEQFSHIYLHILEQEWKPDAVVQLDHVLHPKHIYNGWNRKAVKVWGKVTLWKAKDILSVVVQLVQNVRTASLHCIQKLKLLV